MNAYTATIGDSTAYAFFLADAALKSGLALLATLAATYILRRRSAAIVHGLWTTGLTACLALPVVGLMAPTWNLPIVPQGWLVRAGYAIDAPRIPPGGAGAALPAPELASPHLDQRFMRIRPDSRRRRLRWKLERSALHRSAT